MTIIFDYDGTLHDTSALYGAAVRSVLPGLEASGHKIPSDVSDEALSVYLGMIPSEMWRSFMPALPKTEAENASHLVGRAMIQGIASGSAKLYDGITDVLDLLCSQGARLVILSNCGDDYLSAHRKCFSLDRWFEGYFPTGAYDFAPKSAIIPHITEHFPDDHYIVVGDRASDIAAAKENGLPCIGCSYGFGSPEELACCDIVVSLPEKLIEAISDIHYNSHERTIIL